VAKKFTLGRNERLKSRKRIEQLFREGKHFNSFPFRVSYLLADLLPASLTTQALQFGAGAGTKNFKKAVDRNRIKRLTREAWRLQKNGLQEIMVNNKTQLVVFFIYTAKELPEYNFVYEKTGSIINKLIKIINEKNAVAS
jgi:ribonuclease P protein component